MLRIQARSGQMALDFFDDAGCTFGHDLGEIGNGVGQGRLLPDEVDGKPFVDGLAERGIIVVPDPFLEIAADKEGKHLPVEQIGGFLGKIIGVQGPVGDGEQFVPDHGAVAVRVYHHPDILCGGGARDEVILPDDGFAVFHQVLEGMPLAQFGNPVIAAAVFFKPVFLVPFGDQLRPLRADFGPGREMDLQEILDPGEIVDGIGGKIRVLKEPDSRVDAFRLHAVGASLLEFVAQVGPGARRCLQQVFLIRVALF